MVESSVGGDPARPGAEIAGRVEARSRFVDAPECFHGQILSNSAVANDADSPGVNFLLVLSKQRLEGFQVARRETLQQLHLPLSILNYGEIRLWLHAVSTLERDMRRAKKNARSDDAPGRFRQKRWRAKLAATKGVSRCRMKGRVDNTQLTEKPNQQTGTTD